MEHKIILLHGWGERAPERIAKLAEALRSKGFEVLQPHMPGFGVEPPPPIPWTVRDYVEWVIDQANNKGWEKFILVGHSFGGRVSIRMAVDYSERLEALILIASAGIKHPCHGKRSS